ncbi:MAG: HAD family hydrolase [Corynebacterium sp.]|nr:HAD family hydrolase [Corynebacterium sp.]
MVQALVVDYFGVLDSGDEDVRRWRTVFTAARAAGISTAILSADPDGVAADKIREWEYRGVVDAVILAGDPTAEQHDAATFQEVADALGCPLSDCVLVDDSIVNVHAAVQAGMIGVYYQQFDRAIVELSGLLGLEGEF